MEDGCIGCAGFTLIEILLVAFLISILAAIGVTQFLGFNNDAKTAVTKEKLAALKVAVTGDGRFTSGGVPTKLGFEANCQGLPSSLNDLVTQPATGACMSAYNPYTRVGWNGPYVSNADSSWDQDGWGKQIQYSSASRTLSSCGQNGVCGDGDDITFHF
jgi:prepilin-type N-terminal cleavage/methylation domain-containing protein